MKKLIVVAALAATALGAQAGIVGATLAAHAIGDDMPFCPDGWKASTSANRQVMCVLSLVNLELAVIQLTVNKVTDIAFYLPDRPTFDAAMMDLNERFGQATINPNKNGVFWRPGDMLVEAELSRQRYQISIRRGQ